MDYSLQMTQSFVFYIGFGFQPNQYNYVKELKNKFLSHFRVENLKS